MNLIKATARFIIFWLRGNANPRARFSCEYCQAKFWGLFAYNRGMRHLISKHAQEGLRVVPLEELSERVYGKR